MRLLPAEDLGLLGADRAGLFVGPAVRRKSSSYDWYHPNGVVVDGELAGQWGRRGGRVEIGPDRVIPARVRDMVAAEALTMPVPHASCGSTSSTTKPERPASRCAPGRRRACPGRRFAPGSPSDGGVVARACPTWRSRGRRAIPTGMASRRLVTSLDIPIGLVEGKVHAAAATYGRARDGNGGAAPAPGWFGRSR